MSGTQDIYMKNRSSLAHAKKEHGAAYTNWLKGLQIVEEWFHLDTLGDFFLSLTAPSSSNISRLAAMAEEVIAAIEIILSIIGAVGDIQSLLGGDAANVISVADLERVVRGENARFFTTIAFADLVTIHDQFYNNWLLSITSHDRITPEDINSSTGTLYLVFQDLVRVKTELSTLMNRVREVFRTYQNDLHIDELVAGVLAFMHGFALLFHIHGVYAELRRIQIGAESLDDERLLTDTLAVLQYNVDARDALDLFMGYSTSGIAIYTCRTDMISSVKYYVPPIATGPKWYYEDSYQPLASTPTDSSLFFNVDGEVSSEEEAEIRREVHVKYVVEMINSAYNNAAEKMRSKCSELNDMLLERESTQSGRALGRKPLEQASIETGKPISGLGFTVAVPVDAAEFVATSERLRKEVRVAAESSLGEVKRGE